MFPDEKDTQILCYRWTQKLSKHCRNLPLNSFRKSVIKSDTTAYAVGGHADIYRGRMGNRELALKVLRARRDDASNKALLCEALAWFPLRHPHIVAFYGVNVTLFPNLYCLLAQWMPNGTINEYLRDKNPAADRVKLMVQVASAVEYLHSMQLVHRDIKGDNILIDEHGSASLSDFGITRLTDTIMARSTITLSPDEGTLRWMAPELLDGENVDCSRKTDIYAYAITLYEVFAGCRPYPQLSDAQVLSAVVLRRNRPCRSLLKITCMILTEKVWEIMQQGWADKPCDRPDISGILQYLKSVGS